ncbi:GNAT family N-acetyltransferase [Teichococcus vastitatis]|uniref:GNAT family N-acetyltransferase n=1 Tax=Teichococcus vastitatis TaxID=2307076 RepID=A0ABS9W5F4_9PROT|nr:GNAT family N-acetyltransferase [Pseudoroseomonas vastitatis]MCI0754268.1 GNAT family N-acetyltransferase [Pseudoroseomonas vastitatis]
MDALARVGSPHTVRTRRLVLRPVEATHLADLVALKGDEAAFGLMLHGVRTPDRTEQELRDDIAFWAVRGYGTWAVHRAEDDAFLGIAGLMERPDGRGVALRFALWPWSRGQGYAREAARAALEFGHRAGLKRIIAVARDSNHASRAVLGDLGLRPCGGFEHQGHPMLVFESLRAPSPPAQQTPR